MAVGLLLTTGRALPTELEARLAPLAEPARPADAMIVLWLAPAHRELPPLTKQVWDKLRPARASLRSLSDGQAWQLAAAAGWHEAVAAQVPGAGAAAARAFLASQCAGLLPLVTPSESWKSAEPATAAAAP